VKLLKKLGIYVLLLAMTLTMVACGPSGGETTTTKPTTAAPTTAKPTTAAPTTTPEPTTSESGAMEIPVDNLTTYMSIGEQNPWKDTVYTLGEGNTGKQYVKFNLTPLVDGIDGGVHFAGFGKEVAGFADLAIAVRMAQGVFDARNGDVFDKLAEVPVVTNTAYLVEIMADMDAKTYTVYITPDGGEKTLIAENYAFRTTANDTADLGKVFFISAAANDELQADSFTRMAMYTEGKEYWSYGENYGWQQHPIYLGRAYTGIVKIEFDMYTNVMPVGGSVSFTNIDRELYNFPDLCMLCRMNYTFYDARNGDNFETLGDVPLATDTVYHCEILADMDAKTHSMWVTPPGGERTLIAEDYAFRTTANDAADIGKVYVISAHASDQICMKNLKIEDAQGSN